MSLDMIQRLNELTEQQQIVVLIEMIVKVQESVQALDRKVTPMVDLYTRVQALGWAGKIAVGIVVGILTLTVAIANAWRIFGPPKP